MKWTLLIVWYLSSAGCIKQANIYFSVFKVFMSSSRSVELGMKIIYNLWAWYQCVYSADALNSQVYN